MDIEAIPVQYLALSGGEKDNDGTPVVVLTLRGLDPELPYRPSNIHLTIPNTEKLFSDLREVMETLRRRRIAESGPSDDPPLSKFV